ncbi:PLD nuclease N-terminal domain-containing protein [Mucilaginibacter sp. UR6-1]|uniref:PLD nuclease N-terminal domain-containing protein n=1 Tax=Mucilaginibacter sp. UR6-1 TaxID=1435643 RepID=UPI001E4D60DE|nr:PLD nuclease N-terminal domain-containing protein [Mucilaginibacter sp. UR6-1]MCC8409553.1 PLD nuclease N-terminal domain-containing protein [Mucilaginibacter sp. UR6-1]
MEPAFLSLGTPEIILIFFVVIIPILTLIDIVRSDFKDQFTKLLWVVIVLLAPFIGCLLYLLIGRSQKVSKYI